MRHRANARLLALIAALMLAAAADQAGGEVLSLSNQNFRVTWSAYSFEGGFGTIRCPVTIEGSYHSRTIVKTAGSLLGYVTRATSGTCSSGGMTILRETLPWHVQYTSFSGTLPNITAVQLAGTGAGISIREPVFGITCLGRTTAERPMTLSVSREAGGLLTTGSAGGTIGTSCGVEGTLSGSGNVTLLGSSTRIRLELVEGFADIEIAPAPPPIPVLVAGGAEVTLRIVGIGRVTITGIEVPVGGAIFEIRDTNCIGRTLSWLLAQPRECRFRVFANEANREGEVRIRYTRPAAEAKNVRVRS